MAAYEVRLAKRDDIPAIASLFTEAFRDSVLHHCGTIPKPRAMEDVFGLVWAAEPEAAFVACDEAGRLAGYCFAPARLYLLWLRALLGGYLLVWTVRWLTGQYGFGLRPLKLIFANKLFFLQSAVTPGKTAGARILSIAVAQSARGQGIASLLMDRAVDRFNRLGIKRARLEVRPDNLPARRVYENHGFQAGGITRDLQGDWLIMYRETTSSRKGNADV